MKRRFAIMRGLKLAARRRRDDLFMYVLKERKPLPGIQARTLFFDLQDLRL